jgi:hypothetical protein
MMNPLLEFTALAITRFEVPLLDMKDRAWLDLDIVNSAGPAGNIGEFGVVGPRRYIGNAQTFVSVDAAVPVIFNAPDKTP